VQIYELFCIFVGKNRIQASPESGGRIMVGGVLERLIW